MKFSRFLCLIFFNIFLFVSCSSDDSSNNPINPNDPSGGNSLSVGDSAADLLGNAKFTKLAIEIVYPQGFAPTQTALGNLENFLTARTHKNSIDFYLREISTPNGAPYSISEIVEIEKNHRTLYNSGNTIAVFMFFANGNNENDSENQLVLGTAYRNTSVVIFQKTINENTTSPLGPSKSSVETTVLNHEFGHLFGLVDIGSPKQSDHEDPESLAHCITEGCLMNAKAEFAGTLMGMLGDGILDLDAACIADLQANGGK